MACQRRYDAWVLGRRNHTQEGEWLCGKHGLWQGLRWLTRRRRRRSRKQQHRYEQYSWSFLETKWKYGWLARWRDRGVWKGDWNRRIISLWNARKYADGHWHVRCRCPCNRSCDSPHMHLQVPWPQKSKDKGPIRENFEEDLLEYNLQRFNPRFTEVPRSGPHSHLLARFRILGGTYHGWKERNLHVNISRIRYLANLCDLLPQKAQKTRELKRWLVLHSPRDPLLRIQNRVRLDLVLQLLLRLATMGSRNLDALDNKNPSIQNHDFPMDVNLLHHLDWLLLASHWELIQPIGEVQRILARHDRLFAVYVH